MTLRTAHIPECRYSGETFEQIPPWEVFEDKDCCCFPYYDDAIKALIVKETPDWIVSVAPMIFNDRIQLTAKADYPWSMTAGFCYDKGLPAVVAAFCWDPQTEEHPAGYKKVACDLRLTTVLANWEDEHVDSDS